MIENREVFSISQNKYLGSYPLDLELVGVEGYDFREATAEEINPPKTLNELLAEVKKSHVKYMNTPQQISNIGKFKIDKDTIATYYDLKNSFTKMGLTQVLTRDEENKFIVMSFSEWDNFCKYLETINLVSFYKKWDLEYAIKNNQSPTSLDIVIAPKEVQQFMSMTTEQLQEYVQQLFAKYNS